MADDKDLQFGNEGRELKPGKTENLSSVNHEEGDAKKLNDKLRPDNDDNPNIVKDR